MRHLLVVALASVGCGKELNAKFCAAHPDDQRCVGEVMIDARPIDAPFSFPVAHLTAATEAMLVSTADITIVATGTSTMIDTTAGTITPDWPDAVILPSVAQEDGPNVMVIQVRTLTLASGAEEIIVVGDKPLIIAAATTITLGARLNASASGDVPGPGGYAGALGPGAGQAGGPANTTGDGGGGGGSYRTKGGRGGDPQGGLEGSTYGAATRLDGGSGGGEPSKPGTCAVVPGAGGGAIQLTALTMLTINTDGSVHTGGSGGDGGIQCGSDGSGGAGGGAGGMIYLESPMLVGAGRLGATGGGGGEGASQFGGTPGNGGADAGTDTVGTAGANGSSSGGDGGDGALDAQGVDAADPGGDFNGGGGGGGGGWIFYSTSGTAPAYVAHPPITPV